MVNAEKRSPALVHVFPRPGFCRQARWDLCQRWTKMASSSVRSFCGFKWRERRRRATSDRCPAWAVEIFRLEQWREKAIGGIDASLKHTQGRFTVQAELDSAYEADRRVDHAGGTAGGQDGDLRALWGGGGRGDECLPLSPGCGIWLLRHLDGGSAAAWGICPLLVLFAMTFWPALPSNAAGKGVGAVFRQPAQSREVQALLSGDRSCDPGGIALGGRGLPQGCCGTRLRVCRDIRVARKRVLRLMRENNLLSPHRCRQPWRQSP